MAPPSTRLVNIQTGKTEPFILSHMPIYIAISHTWADSLFPPNVPFAESSGRLAITRLRGLKKYSKIAYCWIDTLCIDQNDDGDKQRQIPLMGQIYGGADTVAILVKDHLGLTQAGIDAAFGLVHGAIEMSRSGSWLENGKEWSSSGKRRGHLKRAMDVLEVFTRPAWGSRVWTIQEFILAKDTIWIGGDLQPIQVDARVFQAIPDVCNHLSIVECLSPRYSKLYGHFQGMAGAHLGLIDPTRVMELLGNKIVTVPEDEIYGLMSASGVVLDDASTVGKEMVWARWWEKAILEGNLRWALLPPAMSPGTVTRNCAMPDFPKRHLCSTNSGLDAVKPYGPIDAEQGTVSAIGRMAGRCRISKRLGRIYLDADGHMVRDITLCLFARKDWSLAMKIASAFGVGRYHPKQRAMIAQTLFFNYYRAKLAVMTGRTSSFRPYFTSEMQRTVWSDFMMLQGIHMPVMNEGVAFLATIRNASISTDVVVVTAGKRPSRNLWAIDFGAINESEKNMFMILSNTYSISDHHGQGTIPDSPSFHKEGVSMYMQVTNTPSEASRFASHVLEEPESFQEYRFGGAACLTCRSLEDTEDSDEELQNRHSDRIVQTTDLGILRYTRVRMLKQYHELRRKN
jgi:hypothetical protein